MRRGIVIAVIVFSLLLPVTAISCDATQEPEGEAVIGPDGGILEVTDPESPIFGVKLVIPDGAVDEDVIISLSEGIDGDDPDLIGIPISCKPDGYLFDKEVALTLPLGGPFPEDYLLMLLVYNGTSGTYEYAGRLVEIHTGDTEATVDITHFSSFQFMGADDYFGRLNSIQLLATSVWSIKSAIEAKDCSELNSIKQLLIVFQNDYEEAMEGFTAAHEWCSDTFTLSNLLEQVEIQVYSYVTLKGLPIILHVTMPGIALFLGGVLSAVSVGLLASVPLCFLWTSWLHPMFLNAWAGYTVCEYGIATIELALLDGDICEGDARISITPSGINQPGDSHDFTVIVEKNPGTGWVPATDVNVTPTHSGVGSITSTSPYITDSSGQVTVTVNSAVAGTATVHASGTVTVGGVPILVATNGYGSYVVDNVKTWGYARIRIDPPEDINVLGDSHSLTASVETSTDGTDWDPYEGATVTFEVTSGPGNLNPLTDVTDASGEAETTLSSSVSGISTVIASTTVHGTLISTDGTAYNSNPAMKEWV